MKRVIHLFLFATVMISFAFQNSEVQTSKPINVVIDMGHGGSDFGATVNSVSEKNIVEQIAKKIKSSNENVKLYFTRNEDKTISLPERVDYINQLKPDLVLSIHTNANNSDKEKSGADIFISDQNVFSEKSSQLANKLSSKLAENNLFKINKLKTAPFFILKKTNAPAVLVELGYLTNESDFKYLTDSKSQDIIANSISEYISELQ